MRSGVNSLPPSPDPLQGELSGLLLLHAQISFWYAPVSEVIQPESMETPSTVIFAQYRVTFWTEKKPSNAIR